MHSERGLSRVRRLNNRGRLMLPHSVINSIMMNYTIYEYNNNYPYHMTYWKYCLGNKVRSTVFFRANHYKKKNICFIRTRFWPRAEEHFFSTDDSLYCSYYTIHVIYILLRALYMQEHEEFVKRLSHHSYVQFCRAVTPLYYIRIVSSRPQRLDWMWRLLWPSWTRCKLD